MIENKEKKNRSPFKFRTEKIFRFVNHIFPYNADAKQEPTVHFIKMFS